jgi:hypothetical protein
VRSPARHLVSVLQWERTGTSAGAVDQRHDRRDLILSYGDVHAGLAFIV